jgi:hypothetical protein
VCVPREAVVVGHVACPIVEGVADAKVPVELSGSRAAVSAESNYNSRLQADRMLTWMREVRKVGMKTVRIFF